MTAEEALYYEVQELRDQLKQRDETIKQKEVAFKLITGQQFEELLLEREINTKLHAAMVTAEQRGSDKANEEIQQLKEALSWALSEAGPFHDYLSCKLYDEYRKLLSK